MEKKFSRNNIVRAVDFISEYETHSMWKAYDRIKKAKTRVKEKNQLCEDIKELAGIGDTIIKNRSCKLNTDLMYRVFRRDANRYATKQARRIKFYELVTDLYMNYQECRAHIMCSATKFPENLPAYKKELEDDHKWWVLPDAGSKLSQAMFKDSNGIVHNDFLDYAIKLKRRADGITPSKLEDYLQQHGNITVQAMVYTGKFNRMYPIILMLTLDLDRCGNFRIAPSYNINLKLRIPDNWIPIMFRIPKEPRKESADTTTQGETR
jgi:hypothetical protein